MVIDNLQKRHLVRRERDPSDRRYVIIHLTEAGQQLISGLFPQHVSHVVREIGVLSPAEQAQLEQLLKKLGLGEQTANGSHP